MPVVGSADVQSIATGIGIVLTTIGLAVAGVWQGIKTLRKEKPAEPTAFVGGVLMENASMTALSERLRTNSEDVRANTSALGEVAQQIERLRDKL